jgi:hypothetical protein
MRRKNEEGFYSSSLYGVKDSTSNFYDLPHPQDFKEAMHF